MIRTRFRPGFVQVLLQLLFCSVLVAVSSCSQGPADLPAGERPIPALLEPSERVDFRKLPLQGANNFRDLGGYPAAGDRVTRWGLVYRSDKLSDLTDQDIGYLQRLGLHRIVDLRSQAEKDSDPDQLGASLQQVYVPMPIEVSEAQIRELEEKIKSGDLSAEQSRQFLRDANRAFVDDYTPLYSEWLHSLLKTGNLPIVFHCTEGKDRTGFAAAILLLAVGVDEQLVFDDYLASNQYLADSTDSKLRWVKIMSLFQVDTEAIRPVFNVERSYLQSAFQRISERYGSFQAYLREGLGIDAEEQQQLTLLITQPVPQH